MNKMITIKFPLGQKLEKLVYLQEIYFQVSFTIQFFFFFCTKFEFSKKKYESKGKPPNCWNSFDAILNCSDIPLGLESDDYDNYLFLQIPSGKKGRYDYLKKLSQGTTFVNHSKLAQMC